MRKIIIGLASFAVVGIVFLLYSLVDRTPLIETNSGTAVTGVSDSNIDEFGDANNIGKIGDVGVETIEKSYYVTRNEDFEIVGEFGFEVLLHKEGDIWELQKPYRNVYQPDFTSYMTADKGSVRVETAAGSTTPKDATFSGNVVIHIVPEKSSDIKECKIYLDDLVFLSDMSQLATDGPVTVVSKDFNMVGVGMKLVYNEVLNRLELFRIFDLRTLVMKLQKSPIGARSRPEKPPEAGSEDTVRKPVESAPVADLQESEQQQQRQKQYYKCMFSRNVLIDTPEQLIFADKQVVINDIFWSSGSDKENDSTRFVSESDANEPDFIVTDTNESRQPDTTIVAVNEPNEPSENLVEVTVTCEDGMIITPKEFAVEPDDLEQVDSVLESDVLADIHEKAEGRITLITESIEHSALIDDTLASGPTELTFYAADSNGTDPNRNLLPVVVTAQKQARFLKTTNQVVFEGDCFCKMGSEQVGKNRDFKLRSPILTVNLLGEESDKSFEFTDIIADGPAELDFYIDDMTGTQGPNEPLPTKVVAQTRARFVSASKQVIFEGSCRTTILREDPNFMEEFTLLSEKMTVDLPKDVNDRLVASESGIKHLTAEGGEVTLAALKNAKGGTRQAKGLKSGRKLGGIQIKCSKIDYSSQQQLFLATGPALVTLNNTEVKESSKRIGTSGIGTEWWVIVENCDSLQYSPSENRIIADSLPGEMLDIQYVTFEKGEYGPAILATAGHVDIKLIETEDGQTKLSTLYASRGIDYKDNGNRFMGSELLFEQEESLVTVAGDNTQPCYFNGSLVDGIRYNLKTGKVKAQVVGPGSLRVNKK